MTRPLRALPQRDHHEERPQPVPARQVEFPRGLAAEEALPGGLHHVLGIDLAAQLVDLPLKSQVSLRDADFGLPVGDRVRRMVS